MRTKVRQVSKAALPLSAFKHAKHSVPTPLGNQLPQPHLPWRSIKADGAAPPQNSFAGNGILRNTRQGSSSSTGVHSFSGMQHSTAWIIYCAGRTMRTTEKIPSETVRYRLPFSPRYAPSSKFKGDSKEESTDLGRSFSLQQQQQLHSDTCSTILVPKITGVTTSTIALGPFFSPQSGLGQAQK